MPLVLFDVALTIHLDRHDMIDLHLHFARQFGELQRSLHGVERGFSAAMETAALMINISSGRRSQRNTSICF